MIGVLTMLGFVLLTMAVYGLVFVIVVGLASTVVLRLHDRGRSGWWLAVYCVLAYQLLTDPSLWYGTPIMASLVAGAVLIWELIALGVLPGPPADQSAEPA